MGLTQDLGRFVAQLRYAALPEGAMHWVGLAFADTVGTMIAGRNEPVTQRLVKTVQPAPGESRLLWGAQRVRTLDAALVNATSAHALDYDDAAQKSHISTMVVPAILAQADALGSSGQAMATAYVAGYEVFAELIRREQDIMHNFSWHPTGAYGAIACAAAGAVLLGLDETQSANALAIAASHVGGVIANFGSDTKPLHAGRGAHGGLFAAAAAQQGFTGSLDALEHPKGLLTAVSPNRRVDLESPSEAGRVWKITRDGINLKKYPACFCGHRAMDGLHDLIVEHDLRPGDVSAITVHISPRNKATLRYSRPQTGLQAKFSMEFAMAAMLHARRVGLVEVTDEFVQRPEIQRDMAMVCVETQDVDDPRRPGEVPFEIIEVRTKDGRMLRKDVEYARGNAVNPLFDGELLAKLEGCLVYGGVADPARPLFDRLIRIDQAGGTAQL
ncbi:MmgE/PrpD family protein [Caenimonas aquaedulcis]|uniref:MmgE/PrpD family protein n=1 Tax=Caenimonas aquaedulcis TaxID=2793270 RepID=A0A931MJ42_9BURK|nr:MmgE/PrpD family protein [Caenimonas aquaedulcis]MBG9390692.1 MmgE/PrpD family protein [Caenimonas aquaedulcis]